jgi:uncharacterized membrane protein YebE (DUF533 family)
VYKRQVLETSFLLALTRSREHRLHAGALAAFGAVLALVSVETISTLANLRTLAALAVIGEMAYLLTPAAGLAYIVASQLVQPASTRARPTPPAQAKRDPQPEREYAQPEHAYSLNGHDPK